MYQPMRTVLARWRGGGRMLEVVGEAHIFALAGHLKAHDCEELARIDVLTGVPRSQAAVLREGVAASRFSFAWVRGGTVMAIGGVVPVGAGVGAVWALTRPLGCDALRFTKVCLSVLKGWRKRFSELVAIAYEGSSTREMRWLRFVGFLEGERLESGFVFLTWGKEHV